MITEYYRMIGGLLGCNTFLICENSGNKKPTFVGFC